MQLETGAAYILVDAAGRMLGKVRITGPEGEHTCGKIEKYPEFSPYDELFREHEECVSQQRFLALDEIEARISEIGAGLLRAEDTEPIPIGDLQIMNADDICFRL